MDAVQFNFIFVTFKITSNCITKKTNKLHLSNNTFQDSESETEWLGMIGQWGEKDQLRKRQNLMQVSCTHPFTNQQFK